MSLEIGESDMSRARSSMASRYDWAYRVLAAAGSPYLLVNQKLRAKLRDAIETRNGAVARRTGSEPCVMIHAVSVGELNAARPLIDGLLQAQPDLHIVITTTTLTGDDRAIELYGSKANFTVARFPLDLTNYLDRFFNAVRPHLVVLMELELWPNFMAVCEARKIPVVVGNGRITEPSYKKYRLLGPITRKMFSRASVSLVQEEVYAERFRNLGARDVRVVGTMKFDSASTNEPDGAEELASAMGLDRRHPTVVAGSTGPGEESLLLDFYARCLAREPDLQLVIVPRKPERFDEVALLIQARGFACARRSRPDSTVSNSRRVLLGDTMGELRKFYALADVVFVGRSLVDLGAKQNGSDMIEPAALGKPVIVGRFTQNFLEPMNAFRAAKAIIEVSDITDLGASIERLLNDPDERRQLGDAARQVVETQRGSTERHLEVILPMIKTSMNDHRMIE